MPSLFDTVYRWTCERLSKSSETQESPIFIGIQGPQGSGKSTLCAQLAAAFRAASYSVVILGLDDFYYAWDQQPRSSPNRLLSAGRSNPGTHDIPLCLDTLMQLKNIHALGLADGTSVSLQLPGFDKSLHAGEGDRIMRTESIRLPLRLVILEGWCLGFTAIEDDSEQLNVETADINHHLKSYSQINTFFDLFIQLKIDNLNWIYDWRLEQENTTRKKSPQSQCLSDAQVAALVTRCLPIYRLYYFNDLSINISKENILSLKLDKERNVAH